jgi:hypothetical protein
MTYNPPGSRGSPVRPSFDSFGSSMSVGLTGLGLDEEIARQEDEGETVGAISNLPGYPGTI